MPELESPEGQAQRCPLCFGLGRIHKGQLRRSEGGSFAWTCCEEAEGECCQQVCRLCDDRARAIHQLMGYCVLCKGAKKIHRSPYYRIDPTTESVKWECCQLSRPCKDCPECVS